MRQVHLEFVADWGPILSELIIELSEMLLVHYIF